MEGLVGRLGEGQDQQEGMPLRHPLPTPRMLGPASAFVAPAPIICATNIAKRHADAQVCQLSETLSADRGAVVRLVLAMPAIVTVPQVRPYWCTYHLCIPMCRHAWYAWVSRCHELKLPQSHPSLTQNLVASHFAKLDAVLGHGGGREAVIGLVAANPSLLGLKM